MPDSPQVRWTAKAPLLAAGVALIIGGLAALRSKSRAALLAGAVLLALGGGFIWYSFQFKEWCAARNVAQSAFSSGYGGSFHECLRQKGWLEF